MNSPDAARRRPTPLSRIGAVIEREPGGNVVKTTDPASSHAAARDITLSGVRVTMNERAITAVYRWPVGGQP